MKTNTYAHSFDRSAMWWEGVRQSFTRIWAATDGERQTRFGPYGLTRA